MKERIRKLISENDLKSALEEAIVLTKNSGLKSLQNQFETLRFKYEGVKKQELMGLMEFSQSLREQTSITNSILELIDQITPKSSESETEEVGKELKKILFLASSPNNLAKIQLEKEFVRISSALQEGFSTFDLKAEWAITPSALQEAILKHRPSIIHFSGHGENTSDTNKSGGIYLNNSNQTAKLVDGEAIAELFQILTEKLDLELVLLNSCYSEHQVEGISKYVPYVIGMNDAIYDSAAITFSSGFYNSLAKDDDIEFAFKLAKNRISLEGLPDGAIPILIKNENE